MPHTQKEPQESETLCGSFPRGIRLRRMCGTFTGIAYLAAFEKASQKLRIVWIKPPKTVFSSSVIFPFISF